MNLIYSFTLVLTKANPTPPCLRLHTCDQYLELTSGTAQVENILNLDEQILRTTHLRATNKFMDVNNVKEKKNPYIQEILKELEEE